MKTKAERLAVAAAVAPSIRSNVEKAKARRVAVVDKNGNVIRYTTLAEVQKAALETAKIELEPGEGVRPKIIFCEDCGKPRKVGKTGALPIQCWACFREQDRARRQARAATPKVRQYQREHQRQKRRENPEQERERGREAQRKRRSTTEGRERKREYDRKRRARPEEREQRRQYQREYNRKARETTEGREYQREWRRRNRERLRGYFRKWRAKQKANEKKVDKNKKKAKSR